MCLSWRGKESQKWGIKLKNEQEEKQSFATVSYKNRIEKPSVCVRVVTMFTDPGGKKKELRPECVRFDLFSLSFNPYMSQVNENSGTRNSPLCFCHRAYDAH